MITTLTNIRQDDMYDYHMGISTEAQAWQCMTWRGT